MQKENSMSSYRGDLRTKILRTAMRNFRDKGIKAVKMDDIASQLSISKRTLYEIFDNKESLLFAAVRFNDEEFERRVETLHKQNGTVMDFLVSYLRLHIEDSSRTNPLFFVELPKYPRIMEYIEKKHEAQRIRSIGFMLKGVEEGFFRDDVNYHISNHIAEVFMKNVMDTEYYHTYPLPEIIKNVILIILRGLCTEKGLRQIDKLNFDIHDK